MLRIFLLRAFVPSWQTSFRSEAEKKFLLVIFKEFVCTGKNCLLRLTTFKLNYSPFLYQLDVVNNISLL